MEHTRRTVVVLVLVSVFGCGGGGNADGGSDGPTPDACEGLSEGDPCGEGLVCVSQACVASRCGDGVVDGRTEACDDGNETTRDGCEPTCALTCVSDDECDDADPCTGVEACDDAEHVCSAGTALDEGVPCSTPSVSDGVCRSDPAECVPVGCGNGVVEGDEPCDDEQNGDDTDGCRDDCTFSCTDEPDCTDDDVCTGAETCDVATHTCNPGTPIPCEPLDDCHAAECDAALGCLQSLIDADEDGHPSLDLGPCGDDCDDLRDDVFPGAEELCDGIDNNCNVTFDEVPPSWYADCDGDGYAPNTFGATAGCAPPDPSATGCGTAEQAWTSLRPTADFDTDCNDLDASVHPRAAEIDGNGIDDDCDGRAS